MRPCGAWDVGLRLAVFMLWREMGLLTWARMGLSRSQDGLLCEASSNPGGRRAAIPNVSLVVYGQQAWLQQSLPRTSAGFSRTFQLAARLGRPERTGRAELRRVATYAQSLCQQALPVLGVEPGVVSWLSPWSAAIQARRTLPNPPPQEHPCPCARVSVLKEYRYHAGARREYHILVLAAAAAAVQGLAAAAVVQGLAPAAATRGLRPAVAACMRAMGPGKGQVGVVP